jgi:type IV secretion system protein TrbB
VLAPTIASWPEDPAIVEVMLNLDGRLWVDRLTEGLADTGQRLSAAKRIVRLVAHHVGAEVHPGNPRISPELPETGERFEGLVPPVVAGPAFAIRKPAVAAFTPGRLRRLRGHEPKPQRSCEERLPAVRMCSSPAAHQRARRRW